MSDETERDILADRDSDVGDELAARAGGFWRLNIKSEPYYVARVEHLGFFKWRWIVTRRTDFSLAHGPAYGDETIIYGTRRTRHNAEKVAYAMRDGFIAVPLPERPR